MFRKASGVSTITLRDREVEDSDTREIVKQTVRETLTTLGFDVRHPLEVQKDMAALREVRLLTDDPEFQRDMIHVRKWRKTMDKVEGRSTVAALGFACLGGIALIFYAFKAKFFGL